MIDMTDYEYDFPSLNEQTEEIVIQDPAQLAVLQPEMWPQTNALIEVNDMENFPRNATSKTHKEL